MMSRRSTSNCAASIGLLTLPHHTCASLDGSLTTNLSFGERPVCAPVRQTSGPSCARMPSWRRMACSYNAAADRLKWTGFEVCTPWDSSPCPTCVVLMKIAPNCRSGPARIETIDGTDGKPAKSITDADLALTLLHWCRGPCLRL